MMNSKLKPDHTQIYILIIVLLGSVLTAFILNAVYGTSTNNKALAFTSEPEQQAPTPTQEPAPAPEPKAEAIETVFVVSWENPTKSEADEDFPATEITGYDIYYKLDDGAESYAKWSPYSADTDIREYKHTASGYGKHCFSLTTVSKNNGKSQRSEWVCYDLEESTDPVDPVEPVEPVDPELPTTKPRPVKEISVKVTFGD